MSRRGIRTVDRFHGSRLSFTDGAYGPSAQFNRRRLASERGEPGNEVFLQAAALRYPPLRNKNKKLNKCNITFRIIYIFKYD